MTRSVVRNVSTSVVRHVSTAVVGTRLIAVTVYVEVFRSVCVTVLFTVTVGPGIVVYICEPEIVISLETVKVSVVVQVVVLHLVEVRVLVHVVVSVMVTFWPGMPGPVIV